MRIASPPQALPTRNPVARSLALAVLSVAMVVAAVMGAVVFAVLLAVFFVGYGVAFVNNWLRVARIRRRAPFVDAGRETPAEAVLEADYDVVEVAVDTAPRGPGGSV